MNSNLLKVSSKVFSLLPATLHWDSAIMLNQHYGRNSDSRGLGHFRVHVASQSPADNSGRRHRLPPVLRRH